MDPRIPPGSVRASAQFARCRPLTSWSRLAAGARLRAEALVRKAGCRSSWITCSSSPAWGRRASWRVMGISARHRCVRWAREVQRATGRRGGSVGGRINLGRWPRRLPGGALPVDTASQPYTMPPVSTISGVSRHPSRGDRSPLEPVASLECGTRIHTRLSIPTIAQSGFRACGFWNPSDQVGVPPLLPGFLRRISGAPNRTASIGCARSSFAPTRGDRPGGAPSYRPS